MSYSTEPVSTRDPSRSRKKKGPSVAVILLTWIILIGIGTVSALIYSHHLKNSMIQQLDAKWQSQTAVMKADYSKQLTALSKQVKELQGKVDTFNELLTFTKDNTSKKTDNSNKLYSQLKEVKQQLATLQKKMDLLK